MCFGAALIHKMEEYEPIKVLGEGSFGKVYLMKHSETRDLVCTKVRARFLVAPVATKTFTAKYRTRGGGGLVE